MRLEDLNEMQIDALREVGNIGAGHAATSLSQLLGRPIDVAQPALEIVPLSEVPAVFGGPEQLVAAVYSRLLGEIEGGILLMATRDDALRLADFMHDRDPGSSVSFGHSEEVLVNHVFSVLQSAYAASIGRLASLDVLPAEASFALDMAGAILEVATAYVGMTASSAALVRTRLSVEEHSVGVGLFFLPEPHSLEVILGKLGLV